MSNKDNLFSLVKSLNQGEKTFFTKSYPINATKEKLADHIILFYAVDKMDEWDETKLKLKLKKYPFVKHLSVVKNYLFNLILKQLKLYYKQSSIKNELFELLQDAEILAKKGLFRENYKVLLKAEKIADKYEYFTFSLDVYDRLLRLNYDLIAGVETINYSLEIYEKQKLALQKIAEMDELRYLRSVSNAIRVSSESEDEKLKRQLALLENPILKEGYFFKSYNAGFYHYNLRGRIFADCKMYKRIDDSYKAYFQLVEHLESNPDLLRVNLINYSMALNNLIFVNYEVNSVEYEDSLRLIEKLESIQTDNQYLQYRIKEKVIVNTLVYYLLSKKYEEGMEYIKLIEDDFKNQREMYNISFFLEAIDGMAMMYFLAGEYSKSLKQVNFLLNDKTGNRIDIQCFHKILNLLIHYELGNFDHVEYLLKPTEQFLVKHNYYSSFRKEIILFFKEMFIEKNELTNKNHFKKLSSTLSKIEKVDAEKFLFKLFNLREWADQKREVMI